MAPAIERDKPVSATAPEEFDPEGRARQGCGAVERGAASPSPLLPAVGGALKDVSAALPPKKPEIKFRPASSLLLPSSPALADERAAVPRGTVSLEEALAAEPAAALAPCSMGM